MDKSEELKNRKKINFIGIGAQRCGTTWVYRCLETHPEVCMTFVKEVPFFTDDINYSKGESYYLSQFNHCDEKAKVFGEFNPHYLFTEKVIKRIYDMAPEVKLIVSLRNPVEALFSLYKYEKYRGRHQYESFGRYLEKEPERIEQFKYAKNLRKYFNFFPEKSFKYIFMEDIQKDPNKFMKDVYEFLEVDTSHDSVNVDQIINAGRKFGLYGLTRPLYSVVDIMERTQIGKKFTAALKASKLRALLDKFFQTPRNKAGKEDVETLLSDEEEAKILMIFKEDIKDLESITGRDLFAWVN